MIQVIEEEKEWDKVIASFYHTDFYHTYCYHSITKLPGEHPILFYYKQNEITIAIPLLRRKIEGSDYYDLTSVYGYPGPLCEGVDHDFNNDHFRKAINTAFDGQKIISVFSRLNPFIPFQSEVLKNMGDTSSKGKIVNIDLTLTLDEQRQCYNKRLKTYLNKSRNSCSIRKASTQKDVQKFVDIYYENMDRVNASDQYYFDKDYFFNLLNCEEIGAEILLVVFNETQEIVAGAMYMKHKNIVQYHLSGVKTDYLFLNCTKLLIDEMRILSSNQNLEFFNLGGGLGNKKDSLFDFKSSFSKDFKAFKLWKYVVNSPIYNSLVSTELQKKPSLAHHSKNDYFPFYRCIQ